MHVLKLVEEYAMADNEARRKSLTDSSEIDVQVTVHYEDAKGRRWIAEGTASIPLRLEAKKDE